MIYPQNTDILLFTPGEVMGFVIGFCLGLVVMIIAAGVIYDKIVAESEANKCRPQSK